MLAVRSLEDSTERHIRNSMRAYFEGAPGCDLKWITGVIGPSQIRARAILTAGFGQYAFTEPYRDLMSRL
jgi:hypothetical protein